jgi:hypothetical protein
MSSGHQAARELEVTGAARFIQRSKSLVDQKDMHEWLRHLVIPSMRPCA